MFIVFVYLFWGALPSQLRRPPRRATAKAQRGAPAEGSLGLDLMPTETLGQNDQQELPHQRVCCPRLCAMPVQHTGAPEQAREDTSPEKNWCDKRQSETCQLSHRYERILIAKRPSRYWGWRAQHPWSSRRAVETPLQGSLCRGQVARLVGHAGVPGDEKV